jgi:hypothetical protein
MVMVGPGNDIGADVLGCKLAGHRSGQPDRLQAGVHLQGDAPKGALVGQALLVGVGLGDDEGEALGLSKTSDWRRVCQVAVLCAGHTAEHIGARLEHRPEVVEQCGEISLGGHASALIRCQSALCCSASLCEAHFPGPRV